MSAVPSTTQTPSESVSTAAVNMTDDSRDKPTTKATEKTENLSTDQRTTAKRSRARKPVKHHIAVVGWCGTCGERPMWFTEEGEAIREATEEERENWANHRKPGSDKDASDATGDSEVEDVSDPYESEGPEPGSMRVGKESAGDHERPPMSSGSNPGTDVKPEDGTAGTNGPPADHNDAADDASGREDHTMGARDKAGHFKCDIGRMMSTFGSVSEGSDVEREEQVAVIEDPNRPSQTGADTAARLGRPDTRIICSSAEELEEAALTESHPPVQ